MALSHRRPASLLLLLAALSAATFLSAPAAATGKTGQVAVFWGRNKNEGTLREACDSGTYTITIISFLDVFGHGTHHLDLSGHDVSRVGADIKHCQSKNILVFLSIGGFGVGIRPPINHMKLGKNTHAKNSVARGTYRALLFSLFLNLFFSLLQNVHGLLVYKYTASNRLDNLVLI
jgi:chitinase